MSRNFITLDDVLELKNFISPADDFLNFSELDIRIHIFWPPNPASDIILTQICMVSRWGVSWSWPQNVTFFDVVVQDTTTHHVRFLTFKIQFWCHFTGKKKQKKTVLKGIVPHLWFWRISVSSTKYVFSGFWNPFLRVLKNAWERKVRKLEFLYLIALKNYEFWIISGDSIFGCRVEPICLEFFINQFLDSILKFEIIEQSTDNDTISNCNFMILYVYFGDNMRCVVLFRQFNWSEPLILFL